MKNRLLAVSLTALCLVQHTGRCEESHEEASLLATDKKWAELAAAGDVKGVLGAWADDAIVYFPGRPAAVGKQAIKQMVMANRALPGFALTWNPTSAEVSSSNDLGYTRGAFQMTLARPNGELMVKSGDYVCIWKRHDDSSWKCAVEVSRFQQGPNLQGQPATERSSK